MVSAPALASNEDSDQQAAEKVQADMVVVHKGERRLMLLREGEVLKEYKVNLGRSPVGHKTRQGDNKTPEGLYVIDGRKPDCGYYLGLHISYPDPVDVENARMAGVSPGGSIYIHGLPNGVRNKYRMLPDWTRGCIAVSNEEIEEIWELVPDGTLIEIKP
jgi:murein L,D-transpeptidase YafK